MVMKKFVDELIKEFFEYEYDFVLNILNRI